MGNDKISFNSFVPLVPLKEVTPRWLKRIKIGTSIPDLARLGLIGEYEMVEATDKCPRLYYRFNYLCKKWEIYAIDKDLMGYNLLHNGKDEHKINRLETRVEILEDIVIPTEPPTDPPIPPTEPPTEPPKYVHSKIDRDKDLIGGADLDKIIDGGIMILGGLIKWYDASRKFPIEGNYVGVTITPDHRMIREYGESLEVDYKGSTLTLDDFWRGALTLYIFVCCPGQEVPITFRWNEEFVEHFTVAITQESELEKR